VKAAFARLFLLEPRPARLLCLRTLSIDRSLPADERSDMQSTEGFVRTDEGYRLYFAAYGAGQPLLVVPNGIYLRGDFERLAERRTVVFYDVRNRGRSDALSGAAIERGIHHDVDDLDAVRRSFHADRVDVLAHSYIATMPVLYALKYPAGVNRIVQIGPMPPYHGREYPAELKCEDETFRNVLARLAQLEGERSTTDPEEFCRKFWTLLRPLYVADPSSSDKVRWERCAEPNERGAMKYWMRSLLPSIQGLNLTEDQLQTIDRPVLIVHGRKDRSSPYGGGRDWARSLGNARLVTVAEAAHAPWIEAPDLVCDAIETFLDGEWPDAACVVTP
jgi:pimeloyl-ACP methyl ester carboxylesterase